jgi:hypothetical protein
MLFGSGEGKRVLERSRFEIVARILPEDRGPRDHGGVLQLAG